MCQSTKVFFCKTGPQKLVFPAKLTGEEPKEHRLKICRISLGSLGSAGSVGSIGSIESLVLCQSRVWPVSSCSQCAVEELKDQLREPLGLAADTPLALSYQNGPSPEKPSLDTSLDPQRMVSNP